MSSSQRFAAVVVAAGSGNRAGGAPKQFRLIAGKPMVRWSAEALLAAGADPLIVVTSREAREEAEAALAGLPVAWADGGARRCDSARAGLALAQDAEVVLVHDAARPFVTGEHVARLLAALGGADGAILALPVTDTLKRGGDGFVVGPVSRADLWRAQTPQAFRRSALRDAYAALPADAEPTDDAEVVERLGGSVAIVAGDPRLMKITHPEDFDLAERLIGTSYAPCVGFGFDAHRFEPGDAVTICGVRVPHDHGLKGHSDADVGLHALTDALFGAAGLGDIGDWFPPSDPQWRGADSAQFLLRAAQEVAARGGRIVNVDVTIVGERPRVKPHREAMRARVAELLTLPLERVSVKATTTEGMGFAGRGEGLAAQAVASVEFPRLTAVREPPP